eukprot:18401-Heterococcus_DN1.PRE.1
MQWLWARLQQLFFRCLFAVVAVKDEPIVAYQSQARRRVAAPTGACSSVVAAAGPLLRRERFAPVFSSFIFLTLITLYNSSKRDFHSHVISAMKESSGWPWKGGSESANVVHPLNNLTGRAASPLSASSMIVSCNVSYV